MEFVRSLACLATPDYEPPAFRAREERPAGAAPGRTHGGFS